MGELISCACLSNGWLLPQPLVSQLPLDSLPLLLLLAAQHAL